MKILSWLILGVCMTFSLGCGGTEFEPNDPQNDESVGGDVSGEETAGAAGDALPEGEPTPPEDEPPQ